MYPLDLTSAGGARARAQELESSWQGLEAKVTRSREEATTATANVVERVRVLEQRCATVEQDFVGARRGSSRGSLADLDSGDRPWPAGSFVSRNFAGAQGLGKAPIF